MNVKSLMMLDIENVKKKISKNAKITYVYGILLNLFFLLPIIHSDCFNLV